MDTPCLTLQNCTDIPAEVHANLSSTEKGYICSECPDGYNQTASKCEGELPLDLSSDKAAVGSNLEWL